MSRSPGSPSADLHGFEGLDEMIETTDCSIVVVDRTANVGQGSQHREDRSAACRGQQGKELRRRLASHRHPENRLVEPDRDHVMFTGYGVGNECQSLGFGNSLSEICNGHPVEFRSGRDQITFVDCLQAHQSLTGIGARRRLHSEHLFDLFLCHEVSLEKQNQEFFTCSPVEVGSGGVGLQPVLAGSGFLLREPPIPPFPPTQSHQSASRRSSATGLRFGSGLSLRKARMSFCWSRCGDLSAAGLPLICRVSMKNSTVDRPTQLQIWILAT